jgi:hypothetical protein
VSSSEKQGLIYRANVSQIIRRCIDLYNWPALDTETLARRVDIWADAIEKIIPVERIRECFDAAVVSHEGDFPINAFELLKAWKVLAAKDRHTLELKRSEQLVLDKCRGTHVNEEERTVTIYLANKDYIVPCYNCRNEAFNQRCREIKGNLASEGVDTAAPTNNIRYLSAEQDRDVDEMLAQAREKGKKSVLPEGATKTA